MSGPLNAHWNQGAEFFEYSSAANPCMPPIPVRLFPASLHQVENTCCIPLDLSDVLEVPYPCTGPNLLASFIHVASGATFESEVNSTSQVLYVLRGKGTLRTSEGDLAWDQGDFIAMPGFWKLSVEADTDAAFYWVHDGPLLHYLGTRATEARFRPLYCSATELTQQLELVRAANEGKSRNRNGILLANIDCPSTKTVTHTIWSLYNLLPRGTRQKAHRHNSIALDLCVKAERGTYTMMGPGIDSEGDIIDPVRADWTPGSVFVTPPGWWHSHHNESDSDAIVLPVQDAAFHTHMQTLDIKFSKGW
jgi:gentisate 1,2-dioxygenase